MPGRFTRTWNAILTGHAFCALAWWWLMPGGFAPSHARFWTNQVLPWVVTAVLLVARFGRGRWAPGWRQAVVLALPAAWIGAAVGVTLVFPKSMLIPATLCAIVGAALSILGCVSFESPMPRCGPWLVGPVLGVAFGGVLPVAIKTWNPGTLPAGCVMPTIAATQPADTATLTPQPGVLLYPRTASIAITNGRLTLGLQPLLTFDSRSPDGGLTIFASPADRAGPARQLAAVGSSGRQVLITYTDDGISQLTIDSADDPSQLRIQATTYLPRTVWSHLNTFNELVVSGHRRLSIRFSPCPQAEIEVVPMDYPRGRPARFAFLDGDGLFRVVEARNAEKGPFTQLAAGPLRRDQPLTITFLDEGLPRFEVTFEDFAAQADTQLSPTAGWGVPVNAIEFHLSGDSPAAPAELFMTLAATSVGRGYETVGHAAGVYQNRVTVRRIP